MIREGESTELTIECQDGEYLKLTISGPASSEGALIEVEIYDKSESVVIELEDLQHILRWAEASIT